MRSQLHWKETKIIPQHNSIPLHFIACKHHDETLSFPVSKVGSDESIPMMESLETTPTPNDNQ